MLLAYGSKRPKVHGSVFIADGAQIIGDVEIGPESSVWFNSVVRGDVNSITIGKRTNVQDLCVLHVTRETHPLVIGDDVTIGHGAIVHGATLSDCCLIGMGARVLDGSHIGERSLVGAGSVVLEGFEVPPGVLAAGVPARIRRPLTQEEQDRIKQSAVNYREYVRSYRL
jgi:carbonic anhydrase/acetyltransferase-like protein (isoleucine patch superfamily)